MLLALAALVLMILRIAAILKKAHLFKVPLSARQTVRFARAERVILSLEGPRFARCGHLDFQLTSVDGGTVAGRRTWFHARTSGISTARIELMEYQIPGPGPYVLCATGPGAADTRQAVVFMRPHLKQAVACIFGILLSSAVLIVSLVFFLLRLLGTELEG
jgi:hypothetical protein